MAQRLSYPLAVALALGLAVQGALAFLPDPGVGPATSGLPELSSSSEDLWAIFAANLRAVVVIALGAGLTAYVARSRDDARARTRMAIYGVVLAGLAWLYFVSGVDWLAVSIGTSRPDLAFRLVHGYLEWPALLLPWLAVAFALRPGQRADRGLIVAGCACALVLLAGAAAVEVYLVPDLLAGAA